MSLKRLLTKSFSLMLFQVLVLTCGAVSAQSFPSKPLKIIAGYPPGGGTDMQARLIAQKLSERWGQPVVVENLAGGLGTTSIRAVTRSPADGYTLYMGASDHLVFVASLYKNLPFDTLRDLIPVSPVADQPIVIVVRNAIAANSLSELIALAKQNPGTLSFASVGSGSISHLGGELFQSLMGTKILHIPYKGSAPAVSDLLSGQGADLMFASFATVAPHIKAGKLRALAIASESRWPTIPEVPTTSEAGSPLLKMHTWNGIFLPVGTPGNIVNFINQALIEMLKEPEVVDKLTAMGFEPKGLTSEEFSALVAADLKKWQKIIADAGIPIQVFQ